MIVYVHSSGRPDFTSQKTLLSFADDSLKNFALVVQSAEVEFYKPTAKYFGVKMLVLPPEITRLSPTRQWILEKARGVFCLMDDDLRFFKRRKDDPTKFLTATTAQKRQMLQDLEASAAAHGHAGILGREGANRVTEHPHVFATRMMRVLAYDAAIVRKVRARFDRVPTKQDFDMTLQLLRAGYANAVLTGYVQDQTTGSNASGGCSAYRDDTMNKFSSEKLVELHPEFVKVVQKETKTAWGGGVRTDVAVQWKKAFLSSGEAL